jgi:hypothetical protein
MIKENDMYKCVLIINIVVVDQRFKCKGITLKTLLNLLMLKVSLEINLKQRLKKKFQLKKPIQLKKLLAMISLKLKVKSTTKSGGKDVQKKIRL